MRKLNKKTVWMVTAGLMAIVMICLVVLLNVKDVSARDTLSGIKRIVEVNTKNNPYTILEIVPDTASAQVDDGVLVSGNKIEQSMGKLGLYVGGQEPVQLEKALIDYAGTAQREAFIRRLYNEGDASGVYAPITSTSANGLVRPLTYETYQEFYQSEDLDENWELLVKSGAVKMIDHETVSANHIDQLTKVQMEKTVYDENVGFTGDFLRTYQPSEVGEMDPAVNFFANDSYSAFSHSVDKNGDFEPGFLSSAAVSEPEYFATFRALPHYSDTDERVDQKFGYIPKTAVSVHIGDTWNDSYFGKPVYVYVEETDEYHYVGCAKKTEDGKVKIVDDTGAEVDPNAITVSGNEIVSGNEVTINPNSGAAPAKTVPADSTPPNQNDDANQPKKPVDESAPKKPVDDGIPNEPSDSDDKKEMEKPVELDLRNRAMTNSSVKASTDKTDETPSETVSGDELPKTPETPEIDDPEIDDPGSNDPGSNDPGSNDPGSNDPGTNDPGNTPDPTQPSTSENEIISDNEVPQTPAAPVVAPGGAFAFVHFVYTDVEVENIDVYYQVDSLDKIKDGKEYSIDPKRPLVPNQIGTGVVSTNERYEQLNPEHFIYQFNRGQALYTLSHLDTNVNSTYVSGLKIYFAGGFKNNEWFKKQVFDRDAGAQCNNMYIKVKTMKANEVTKADISAAKFIYISNPDKEWLPYGADSTYTKYGKTDDKDKVHDLYANYAMSIVNKAVNSKTPILIDHTILDSTDEDVKDSVVYNLARTLLSKNLAAFYTANSTITNEATLKEAFKNIAGVPTTKHFVNENIYSYDMKQADISVGSAEDSLNLVNNYFSKGFSADVVTDRFKEVREDIENENLYRQADGNQAPLPLTVSEATTIRYIINFAQKRTQIEKDIVRILEIQPCAAYDLTYENVKDPLTEEVTGHLYYKKSENITEAQKNLLVTKGTSIEVVQMTTAEFVGKIEDMNAEYDLIYIGLNTALMNRKTDLTTNYNDNNMDGLIYTNVGDYANARSVMGGLLDTDYVANNRNNNLQKNVGGTVGRYRYSGNDITEEKRKAIENFVAAGYPVLLENNILNLVGGVRTPNAAILDNSSYMYELMDHLKEKTNVFSRSQASDELFTWYLQLSKPSMNLSGIAASAQTQNVALSKADDGYYYLNYEFTLTNTGAADEEAVFDCQLYVDINADGKFSKTKEKVKDIVINDSVGVRQEADGSGKFSLKPNKAYYVKKAVSDQYTGVIPWRLEVAQRDNEARRASKSGFYFIQRENKEELSILQINTTVASNLNLETAMTKNDSLFRKYISQLNNFEVTFETITSSEYYEVGDGDIGDMGYKEYLDQYDMLILGFGDCYREADNDKGAMSAIADYIKSGRSVLFTHDTTSFVNASPASKWQDGNNVTYWGYNFNTLIRNLVGLDRYGVLSNSALRTGKGHTNSEGIWNQIVDKAQNGEKEVAYEPKSARTKTVAETQGFTYGTINTYFSGNGNKNLASISSTSQFDNQEVVKVNTGQITHYPYVLEDTFRVSRTHNQYYQIDLEPDEDKDGESDIVVWYTISDPSKAGGTNDMYAKSPQDVRNNYYIFNKGNVTYSGVGHSGIDKAGNDNEVKLFVNTMIAAYKAGLRAPKVTILDNKDYNSRAIKNIYLSYDKMLEDNEPLTTGLLDRTETVFFTADNVSLVEGDQVLSVKYYYENEAGADTLVVNDTDVKVTEITGVCPLYDATTNEAADVNNIIGSKVYKFDVPTSILLPGNNSVKIHVAVTAVLEANGKKQIMTGMNNVALVRTQMFNLD